MWYDGQQEEQEPDAEVARAVATLTKAAAKSPKGAPAASGGSRAREVEAFLEEGEEEVLRWEEVRWEEVLRWELLGRK